MQLHHYSPEAIFLYRLKLQSTTVPYNSTEMAKVGFWKLGTGSSCQGKCSMHRPETNGI
jgi:hypothetical protein